MIASKMGLRSMRATLGYEISNKHVRHAVDPPFWLQRWTYDSIGFRSCLCVPLDLEQVPFMCHQNIVVEAATRVPLAYPRCYRNFI